MSWKDAAFNKFRLYAVTDIRCGGADELKKIETACNGGIDVIQLRSKTLSDQRLLEIGRMIRKITRAKRKLFFVNDRVDLALVLKADGVHLGQGDMPIAEARHLSERAGEKLLIGRSTHNIHQALEAQRQGADYIGIGPVFATPTKPGKTAVGLDLVVQAAKRVTIPFVAIGGIDFSNISSVIRAGASRIAVVRAVFDSQDPARAATKLKKIIER